MTNFKMSLRLSAVFVLALAFCCLVVGQAVVANGSGVSKITYTPMNPRADVAPSVHELGTDMPEILKPALTLSNRVEVPQRPASSGRPNVERGDKQGGELISNATVITGVPYSDAGTTEGYADNYNEACTYTATGGADVVYSYTPTANQKVSLSLCGSSYDTKLYVYDTDPPTAGSPVACNDDNNAVCGAYTYRSYIAEVNLTAGVTYYIVVDGYNASEYGDYVLDIAIVPDCIVTQPAGATLEGEPCEGDLDTLSVDAINGGCNTTPPVYGSIALDESIYGQTWSNATTGYRDTDWYMFTITEDMEVTLKGVSEAPVYLLLVGATDFATCTGAAVLAEADLLTACDTGSVSAVIPAGTYVFWVGGTGEVDNLCADGPWDYAIWLSGVPAVIPHGATCADPIVVNYTGATFADLGQTNCGMGNDYSATPLGSYDGGEDIIYQINVTGTHSVNIWLDPLGTTYTGWMITTDCPGTSAGVVTGVTNSGSAAYGKKCVILSTGTYYLMIDTYPSPNCIPSFNLTIKDTTCAAPPANDNCANALAITNGSYNGDNTNATGDAPHTTQNNMWYCYTAPCTGMATASMCASPDNSLDLRMYIYSGCTCPVGTAIATDDDFCSPAPVYGTPQITWPVTAGQQYMIEVGNYTGELGPFNLTLTCNACPSTPVNDDCANADHKNITWGVPAVFTGTTECATNDCADLVDPEVWISFTLPDGCSNLKLTYCDGYEGGPGWSVWAHILGECPCGASGYNYTTYTFTCPDGSENFSMTIDSVLGGTYYYPVNQANYGGGYEYVIRVEAIECPPYCASGSSCDEYITRVEVGTIDNASGVCTTGGYADYTDAFSTAMYKGVSYPITVTIGGAWEEDMVKAWVDYNLDFLFDDAAGSNEAITFPGIPGVGPFSSVITPPVTAITGETVLRVRLRWNVLPIPCTVIGYGETEDYTLVLQDLPCGDVNMDGNYDIADIDYLIAYYFTEGAAPLPIPANGDTNGDCCINLADIVYLADHIFRGGADPICLPCNP